MADRDQDITEHIVWCRDLRGLTPATIRGRQWVLNRLALCVDRPLRELRVGHIQFWEQTVVAGLAPQSRHNYIQHVRSFYKWCLKTSRVNDDPTVMLTRPKLPKPLPRPVAEDDLAVALARATTKLAAMLVLMADAGLRAMEVAQISWSDVQIADSQTWIVVRNGKGGRDRVVPVGENVVRALRRHGTKTRGPMFIGRDGKQIRANSVCQQVNSHLRRCGLNTTGHKLRARYATRAAEVLNTEDVAELCGWSSLETARWYIKPDRERSLRLVAALDALALPEPRNRRTVPSS